MDNEINTFVKDQYRELPELNDEYLIANYCKSKSVIKRNNLIKNILLDAGLTHSKCSEISRKLLINVIVPPGTKSTIRGNRFNDIIAKELLKNIKKQNLQLQREKKHSMFHEIPDWIITKNNKTLVGFNQISLFGGGHQLNRGSKYILDDSFHRKLNKANIKMVCVVKDLPFNKTGKSYDILLKGIQKKRLYCIGGLKKMCNDYFL
jgi:hypothetical protein